MSISKMFGLSRFKNTTIIVLALAIFIGINFALSYVSFRLDFSQGRRYTLSQSTKKILAGLKKNLVITFYASSTIPTRLIPLKQEVIDLAKEYVGDSKNVSFSTVDPETNSQALTNAKQNGLPELQFSQLDQNKYALSNAYFGMVLEYNNQEETIPQVTAIDNLEYNMTAAIYKMTKTSLPKVSVFGMPESSDPQNDNLASFKNLLNQQFTLSFDDTVNGKASTIIVIDDNLKEYTDTEIKSLEDYLQKGGKAIFFVDGEWVDSSLSAVPPRHNLFNFFKKYGVTLNQNLVLSADSEMVNFGNGQVNFLVPYPFWLKTDNFNNKYDYFQNISSLTFPWTSTLSLGKVSNVTSDVIVLSTKNSWLQTKNFTLNPQSITQPSPKDLGVRDIAALVKIKGGGEFVLIPSSKFIQEQYLSQSSSNLDFVLNILDDFASGGALSGISTHQVTLYQLPALPDSEKELFKYANILFLPILLAIFGAIRIIRYGKENYG